jgi:membrane protein DedA with SNARE-associated domain
MEIAEIIKAVGYPAVFLLIMGECMGVPLPGETALLIAAAAAGTGKAFNIWRVVIAAAAGAILGDTIGYWIGRKGGRAFLTKYADRFFIKKSHIEKAEKFFSRHGGKAVFFGRSVSYLRVFTAIFSGISNMYYPKFLFFNAAGGIVWAALVGYAGFTFGKHLDILEMWLRQIGWGLAGMAAMAIAIYMIRKHSIYFKKRHFKK